MRVAAGVLLFGVAGVSALLAWGALLNLWADYQDSPDSTYIIFGVPWLVFAVASVIVGVRLLRRP